MSKAMIWPVMVVPISWPSIMPMVWVRVIRFPFTRPIMVTMSRLLLWSAAVATAPKAAALSR